jgi:enoyl-CoA hydratase/carnithine racemase
MTLSSSLDQEVSGGIATVRLARPEKRNALSIALRLELAAALNALGADPEVRCTILTGAPPAFCAGMDTTEFGGDEAHRRALWQANDAFTTALLEHAKPLIAAVNGPALGGGFVLALLSDLRLASAGAQFGFPELRRGIPASYGAARAALPVAVARDLSLTGRVVGADEALRLGIVSAVEPDDARLLALARTRGAEIAALPERGLTTTLGWARSEAGSWRQLLTAERAAFRAALRLRGD